MLVSGSEDTTVRLWSLADQCCTAVLRAHLSYVTSVAFLPGGEGLITGGRDRVLNVWGLDRCVLGPCRAVTGAPSVFKAHGGEAGGLLLDAGLPCARHVMT